MSKEAKAACADSVWRASYCGRMCDGDRYDDRVTEIVDAALERGYTLAFRERGGGWEAAWRSVGSEVPSAVPLVCAATRTEAAELALAAIRARARAA